MRGERSSDGGAGRSAKFVILLTNSGPSPALRYALGAAGCLLSWTKLAGARLSFSWAGPTCASTHDTRKACPTCLRARIERNRCDILSQLIELSC